MKDRSLEHFLRQLGFFDACSGKGETEYDFSVTIQIGEVRLGSVLPTDQCSCVCCTKGRRTYGHTATKRWLSDEYVTEQSM